MLFEWSLEADHQSWNALLAEAGGNVCHTREWADYIAASHAGTTPIFFKLLSEDGQVAGAALGFEERSRYTVLKPLTARLWFDATPVVKSGSDSGLSEFLAFLENFARSRKIVELSIGSFASGDAGPVLRDQGFETEQRLEFEFDLRRSQEQLWEALDFKRRNKLRKAMKSGLRISELSGENGLRDLRRLQAESSDRITARGGPRIAHVGNGDPVMKLLLAGTARIFGAYLDQELLSATLCISFNSLTYQMLSGHSAKGLERQAPTLLLWQVMDIYRQEGSKRFNLGGCSAEAVQEGSPEHGVYVYKKSFSETCLECTSGRKVLRPLAHRTMKSVRSVLRQQ